MPPPSRNQRPPMTSDTPTLSAASAVRSPCPIRRQNSRSTRRGKPHLPGERILGRCARSAACCLLTFEHLQVEVLRRPLESAGRASVGVEDDPLGLFLTPDRV